MDSNRTTQTGKHEDGNSHVAPTLTPAHKTPLQLFADAMHDYIAVMIGHALEGVVEDVVEEYVEKQNYVTKDDIEAEVECAVDDALELKVESEVENAISNNDLCTQRQMEDEVSDELQCLRDDLEGQIEELQNKLESVSDELKDATLENYGGVEEFEKLKITVLDLQSRLNKQLEHNDKQLDINDDVIELLSNLKKGDTTLVREAIAKELPEALMALAKRFVGLLK